MRKCGRWILALFAFGQAALLLAATLVPKPESTFGFKPGDDYKLANYDQTIEYLGKLAEASKYIRMMEAGKTTLGRKVYYAIISDPKNLAKIDRYREIAQRLAHPQGLTDEEAHKLAREGKAFVHLDSGCHASEVAGAQMMPKLAYDLIDNADAPDIKEILDNDIVFLWPTMNPDGQQLVADWFMKNVGTPYEGSSLPRLYQEYVGHDNNRDAYMLNMIESRLMEHFWRQWEPNIIYVFHQSAPAPSRIWLPPFSEPVGLHAPYVTAREINMIGMAIAKGLDERGQTGATHMGTAYDAWYPGYVDYAPIFKNIPAFWTETAGNGAVPRESPMFGANDLRPQSMYSSPWPGGWWRLADAVGYNETASLSTLQWAAKYKDSLLYNRYQAGRDQIAKGTQTAPFAYIVPQQQRDPVAAVEMLRRLAFSGVRISQLTEPATIDGTTYAAGAWIVPTDQEFAAMAREVLDIQKYPDLRQFPGGPPLQPYDAAGWTLPLQMGVKVETAGTPLPENVRSKMKLLGAMPDAKLKPVAYNSTENADVSPFDSIPGIGFDANPAAAAIVPPKGQISGTGPALAVDPSQNNAFRALNRAWKQGATIRYRAAIADKGSRYIIENLPDSVQSDIATSLALTAERTVPDGTSVKKPRIGLFQPWTGSMDEGWTRWLLEQYGFEFAAIHPEDFRTPLGNKIDVLILADDARIPVETSAGSRGGAGAPGASGAGAAGRGAQTGRVVRPEYAYALTKEDLAAFERFVREGGTLVCFNNAYRFIVQQFQLPVRNAAEGLRSQDFFLRGSIVEAVSNSAHPVMAGMPVKAALFVDGSPVFETLEGFKGAILAKYQESGSPLLSGYLIGEKYLNGKAAAVDVELDKGHVILLGFRPEWRCQSFGTFRMVFNSAIFSK
jgi:hypothetical protein